MKNLTGEIYCQVKVYALGKYVNRSDTTTQQARAAANPAIWLRIHRIADDKSMLQKGAM
jgi:hypothetical protein